MDEEMLINLVREHRELYDTEHKQYEDNHRREAAWREIGQKMQQPAHECRDRWKRLRDNYRRARKLRLIKKAQGVKKVKTIKHEKVMAFINPIIEINSNDPTDTSQDDSESAGSSMLMERHIEEPEVPVDPLTVLERNYDDPPPSDTVVTFFTNLGETVKNFPEEIQIRVKRDIFKIINEAEEEVYRNKMKVRVKDVNMKYELSDF